MCFTTVYVAGTEGSDAALMQPNSRRKSAAKFCNFSFVAKAVRRRVRLTYIFATVESGFLFLCSFLRSGLKSSPKVGGRVGESDTSRTLSSLFEVKRERSVIDKARNWLALFSTRSVTGRGSRH